MISHDHWVFYLLVILMHFSLAYGCWCRNLCTSNKSMSSVTIGLFTLRTTRGEWRGWTVLLAPVTRLPVIPSYHSPDLLATWCQSIVPVPGWLVTPPCVYNKSSDNRSISVNRLWIRAVSQSLPFLWQKHWPTVSKLNASGYLSHCCSKYNAREKMFYLFECPHSSFLRV